MKTHAMVLLIMATITAVGVFAASASADWNVGDPSKMHYPQLPVNDPVNHTGITVAADVPGLLADDWRCTETGAVSDIHIWGSWLLGVPDPMAQFKLSIHSNVDATPSHPGPELWSAIIGPAQYTNRLWLGDRTGHWYDPLGRVPLQDDRNIWQYNFENLPAPYVQQQGTIYWLDVQVMSPNNLMFGWTATDPNVTPHFMDDATWGTTDGFNGPLLPPGWTPLVYPPGFPHQGQSIDLAFVITPEPASLALLAMGGLAILRRRIAG
jgi:hypothetical protein